MAVVPKRLAKGTATGLTQTVYTVPTGAKTMVKALTICNTHAGNPYAFSLYLGGTMVIAAHTIKPADTITLPFLDQILESGETITVVGSSTSLTYYISGKEVT